MLTSLLVAGIVVIASACGIVSYKFWGSNNPIEQVAEDVIQAETGAKPNLDAEAAAIGVKPPAKGATASGK